MLQPCRKAAVKSDVCDRGGLVAESGEDLQRTLTPSLAVWSARSDTMVDDSLGIKIVVGRNAEMLYGLDRLASDDKMTVGRKSTSMEAAAKQIQ